MPLLERSPVTVHGRERMLFEVNLNLVVDAIDHTQTEIIALGALQAAKAHVHSQASEVVKSGATVTDLEE
jgi:hypothetical protein